MSRRLLITGAAGNIGSKLRAHFEAAGYELRLIDMRPGPGIIEADIADYGEAWAGAFAGIDSVIHMAGEMRPVANWADAHRGNVIGTGNVLRAMRRAGCRRMVFASTNQVMGGYRFHEGPVTTEMPPAPLNPYAVSKLICEELGRAASADGLSFIALRIGNLQPGENVPHAHMGIGTWGQEMWLSNRDLCHGMQRAVEVEGVPFAVLNLVSDNPGMRWDIGETRRVIGFAPSDGYRANVDSRVMADDAAARQARLEPGYWLDQFGRRISG